MKRHDGADVECMRCGRCCLADMFACASDEDIGRWRREGRDDILGMRESESAVWVGDHFISTRTGRYIRHCPFLALGGELCACGIYETRPKVCADYRPGSSYLCPLYKK
ncbi:MAG: YkgJ family cysteine cluster protein [Spirochaetes bacterium]|nr:MAG: YkgJ family cysteine cluster protein [Spirochaetota bacterium]